MHRELFRRIVYYGCFFVAIILFMLALPEPVVIIDIFEPKKDTRTSGRRFAESLLNKEEQERLNKKRIAEIERNTIDVSWQEWNKIYKELINLKEGKPLTKQFKDRMPSDQYPSKVFFYRPHEPHVKEISHYLIEDNQVIYLRLAEKNIAEEFKYLKVSYKMYSNNDFHLGSGFSRYPRPPTYILYPYRKYSLWILLLGLIFYIFLPVKPISKKSLRYPRWRVIIGDLAATILTFVFFSMPFFITGGVIQAVYPYFILSAVFWLISLLGIYTIKIAVWYSSYEIDLLRDGIKIASYKGIKDILFEQIELFQPVVFKPPKWLIILTWIAALSGRGGAGRAILTSLSEAGSICIKLKDGSEIFIVVTDQMGTTALKGFEKIIETLHKKGIKRKDEIREIRSMGFEIMR